MVPSVKKSYAVAIVVMESCFKRLHGCEPGTSPCYTMHLRYIADGTRHT